MLRENLKILNEKLETAARASGRNAKEILLLAVSKKVPESLVREAFQAGTHHFAENYVQEALAKKSALSDLKLHWHLIGHLQSNKAKLVAGQFDLIHSVDSLKIAQKISEFSLDKPQKILIEVNLAGEKSKAGCAANDLPELLTQVQKLPQLSLRGLMFMAPLDLSVDDQRRYYSQARELRATMQTYVSGSHELTELSMGTSHDFAVAIAEGATIVRVGTALFGERK